MADADAGERCENCRFWRFVFQTSPDEPGAGSCRAAPPVIVTGLGLSGARETNADDRIWLSTRFPITDAEEWCGAWQAKGAERKWGAVDVGAMGFGVRVINRLESMGIRTAAQLVERSADDLRVPWFGPAMIRTVRDTLAIHGLKLRGDP